MAEGSVRLPSMEVSDLVTQYEGWKTYLHISGRNVLLFGLLKPPCVIKCLW